MSSMIRTIGVMTALVVLNSALATEPATQEVEVVFLHFTGENVSFVVDGKTIFDMVLDTEDHTMAYSHSEELAVRQDSLIKWTVDGQEHEQVLDLNPHIGIIYITHGQPQAELVEGDELLLD